jgi:hypothetical protein
MGKYGEIGFAFIIRCMCSKYRSSKNNEWKKGFPEAKSTDQYNLSDALSFSSGMRMRV